MDPAARAEYGPPLTADAGRILAVCWRTAALTTQTNVPPAGHALRKGGADRTMLGRRVQGYYLDRGVNARSASSVMAPHRLVPDQINSREFTQQ